MKKIYLFLLAVAVMFTLSACCSFAQTPAQPPKVTVTYPGWKLKALSFNYDDGVIEDRELIKIFDRYNMKATFNLSIGKALKKPERFIQPAEIKTLYKNHEVASHGYLHRTMTLLGDRSLEEEIALNQVEIAKIIGNPPPGFAYPYGRFTSAKAPARVVEALAKHKLLYARTCKMAGNFDLPQDLLQWHPYCHHNNTKGVAKKFLDYKAEKMSVLIIWGHSYEFAAKVNKKTGKTRPENWKFIENLCKELANKPEIWYATMGDIALYVNATRKLTIDKNEIKNNSDLPVYLICNGKKLTVAPGKSIRL